MAEEGGFLAILTDVLVLLPEILWLNVKVFLVILQTIYRSVFPPEPKSVTGDVVLITGAGHGMGREMAVRFGKLGATVVSVDINPLGNQETINMIKKASGAAHAYQCDITDKKSVDEMAAKVRKEVGDVTILVNNAGIMPCKPILKHTEQDVKAVVNVNVLGNIWTIQAFLPAMLQRNRGHIVAMSSMCGLAGARNVVPYTGTKYAVRGIMEALSVEFDDYSSDTSGIKLTTVYPYIVNTGLAKKPKIRFENALRQVNPGEAADIIIDAVRREYRETSVPANMLMQHKIFRNLPFDAIKMVNDFAGSSLDSHE